MSERLKVLENKSKEEVERHAQEIEKVCHFKTIHVQLCLLYNVVLCLRKLIFHCFIVYDSIF